MNNMELKFTEPEEQVNSPMEVPDNNEGQPVGGSLTVVDHVPTESTGTHPFDDPIFVNATDQYIEIEL